MILLLILPFSFHNAFICFLFHAQFSICLDDFTKIIKRNVCDCLESRNIFQRRVIKREDENYSGRLSLSVCPYWDANKQTHTISINGRFQTGLNTKRPARATVCSGCKTMRKEKIIINNVYKVCFSWVPVFRVQPMENINK